MKKLTAASVVLLGLAGAAFAQTAGKGEGEIRKIDKEASKVTIKHGPLEGMDMPGMTMVFRVKDAALFDRIKEGEAIRFTVVKEAGAMVLTSVEPK